MKEYSSAYISQRERTMEKDHEILSLINEGALIPDIQTGTVHRPSGKPFKTTKSPSGYIKVHVGDSYYLLHRIILIADQGLPPSMFFETAHIDDDKTNNRASNLKWTTRSENVKRAYETGAKPRKGARHTSVAQAVEMTKLREQGFSYGEIAKLTGKDHLTVKRFSDGTMPRATGPAGKTHYLIDPKGKLNITENLTAFCQLNNLTKAALFSARAKALKHKGWTLLYVDDTENIDLAMAS